MQGGSVHELRQLVERPAPSQSIGESSGRREWPFPHAARSQPLRRRAADARARAPADPARFHEIGATHDLLRQRDRARAGRYPHYRHHRDIRPVAQARLWFRGTLRRVAHTLRDRALAKRLEAAKMPPYFFVPLQVHLDSQLGHSPYATVNQFIREVVTTFAQRAPRDHALLLKLHPMDRPYSDYSTDIEALRLERNQLNGSVWGRLHEDPSRVLR